MKNNMRRIIATTAMLLLVVAGAGSAAEKTMADMGSTAKSAGVATRLGVQIHTSKLEKAVLDYNLLEMKKASTEGMKMDHSSMEIKSNHLMVFPTDLTGKTIGGAKVGFLVTGPDGKVQQSMAMDMIGGYGADMEMKAKGKYEVKTKLVKGDLQLLDTFTYEVK